MNNEMIAAMKSIIADTKGATHHSVVAGKIGSDERWMGQVKVKDLLPEAARLLEEYKANPNCWGDFKRIEVAKECEGDDVSITLESRATHMNRTYFRYLADINRNPTPQSRAIIKDVLKEGAVMSVSSKTKARKSFLINRLLRAFVEGGEWLGFQVEKCNVLYVDLELKNDTLDQRLGWATKDADVGQTQVGVLALRGSADKSYSVIFEAIEQQLAERAKLGEQDGRIQPYHVCVIDPLYVLFAADVLADAQNPNSRGLDENSNSDMGYLLGLMNGIAERHKCAIVWVHHFAKGDRNYLSSGERGSGAGALSRAPDAIVTLTPEAKPEEDDDTLKNVLRVEFELRDFKQPARQFLMWDDAQRQHIQIPEDVVIELRETLRKEKGAERKEKADAESKRRKEDTKNKREGVVAQCRDAILSMLANDNEIGMAEIKAKVSKGDAFVMDIMTALEEEGIVKLRRGAREKRLWKKNPYSDGNLPLGD